MNNTLQQLLRFGIIGVIATLIHAILFHTLYINQLFSSLPANLISFIVAFTVSYLGHLKWTFVIKDVPKRTYPLFWKTLFRFLPTALLGLTVNITAGWLIIEYLQLSHYYFLGIVVFFTPALTFLISKYWVFKA